MNIQPSNERLFSGPIMEGDWDRWDWLFFILGTVLVLGLFIYSTGGLPS